LLIRRLRFGAAVLGALSAVLTAAMAVAAEAPRPRVRELGVTPGVLPTGRWNAITDVPGVRVGHRTIVEGDAIRTGITAILPHDGNLFQRKVPGAVHVGNGFGKAAGFLQVRELGNIESPIVLTNTLAVAAGLEGVIRWTLAQPGNENVRSVNAVVGETNDGHLNDIRSLRVTARDVREAIEAARTGPVEEGNVGAGTGTRAFAWKGGIGTSSRVLPGKLGGYTVGALVQTNFGGILTIAGHRVGERLGTHEYREKLEGAGGSCMMVLATDAPLSPRNLERLARRAILGLARTGSFMDNGSGDFVIAFSTKNTVPHAAPPAATLSTEELHNDAVSPLFLAAVESVEEAIYNAITRAATMTGHQGRRVEAIPLEPLRAIFRGAP
jgi:D-aminopeptidase